MEHHVRFPQTHEPAYRDQVGISRSRADNEYSSQMLHSVLSGHTKSSMISCKRRSAPLLSFCSRSVITSGPSIRENRPLNLAASAGLVPLVEIAIVRSPRRTTAGMMKSHNEG